MRRIGTAFLVVTILLVASQALAVPTWYLLSYGKYDLSWGELDEVIQSYNSWTQALGLTDFEMQELDREITIYSLGSRWVLSPRWEIELDTIIFNPGTISESEEKTVSLEGGGQKRLEAGADVRYFMTLIDLMGCYFFRRSSSKLTPFIEAGLTYWTGSISGNYWASEEVYTPPWNYEYRNLGQDFSVFDSRLGYLLGAGIDYCLGKHFRVGLDLKHHWVPKIKCRVDGYNEGFSSSPPVGPEIETDPSGTSYGLYLMFRF